MLKNLTFIPFLFFSALFAQQKNGLDSILKQMQLAAKEQLLDKYYPRNIDTVYGGYLSTFTYDIQPFGEQDKMIVTQSRHTWSTARAALFYKDTAYISMARHGFYFLRDKMWDTVYGGFFNLVNRQGIVKSKIKEAYGNSFAIYALAAYYECSGDINWDTVYGGFFNLVNRQGIVKSKIKEAYGNSFAIYALAAYYECSGDINC